MSKFHDPDEECEMPDGDVLRGAAAISQCLFGDPSQRRQVYHLRDNSGLPAFKLGNTLYARRSKIHAWLKSKEK